MSGREDHRSRYVLVADAHAQRTAACLEALKPFSVDVRVARDGEEAIGILQRSGPPVLLIIDLSLTRKDGFAVIETLRSADQGRAKIVAWSSFRELREFAAHRLAGLNVRVLAGTVAPGVLRGAIERALRNDPVPATAARASSEDVDQMMAELSDKARQLCGTAGVAVYWKVSGETQVRASVTWTSDAPIPRALHDLPGVFDRVLETGQALIAQDIATQPLSGVPTSALPDVVRGLVAVPIVSADQQIVGVMCVFDITPLALGDAQLDALDALGRGASNHGGTGPVRSAAADERLRAPERAAGLPDESTDTSSPGSSTALLDRRGGQLAIAREISRVSREQRQLSVVLFEVDSLRDARGDTGAGSPRDPLAIVGDTLARMMRGSDVVIRWSRHSFLVVLPGLGATEARQVAERVRAAMQVAARDRVAVSGGVAELGSDDTFEAVLARSNEKVREARERGHNRVA